MTSQTKKFIELIDLISFHFRCKGEGCGAELCLPLNTNLSRDHGADKCPNCGANWLLVTNGISGSSAAPLLERVAASLHQISTWPGHFDLKLEIKPDPEDAK